MEHLIEYKEMREAIVRIRELHYNEDGYCPICSNFCWEENEYVKYPCPTIKALDVN